MNWIWIIDGLINDREGVDQRVVIHSCHERNEKRPADYALAGEKLPRNHGDFGAFPFVKDECEDK